MPLAPRRGFTLIELMVVVAIIAILAALGTTIAIYALGKGRESATRQRIEKLTSAITVYQQDFGYPACFLDDLGAAGTPVNEGIEALVLCLTSRAVKAPLETNEEELVNTDNDRQTGNPTNSILGAGALWEIADAWGSPIFYVEGGAYGEAFTYKTADGQTVKYEGLKSKKTGLYHNSQSFQLLSLGEDGKPDTDDDVSNYATGQQ